MANIRLSKQNKTIKVVNRKDNIRLSRKQNKITLQHTGNRGPQGVSGTQGPEGPEGPQGEAGQDANFVQPFTVADTVPVNHNLNKYPAVSIMDSAGDEVEGEVYYVNTTQLIVSFSNPFSGQITCN